MTSHRPYRAALGIADAIAELRANKGRLYDAAAADVCVPLLKRDRTVFLLRGASPSAEAAIDAEGVGVER